MSKRAYLVVGPESSGTRWITRILIDAGCHGADGHVQPWDKQLPQTETPIVWRRSFPHGDIWPDLRPMLFDLRLAGYAVTILVMVRDWLAMSQSQLKFQKSEDIPGNIRRAYREIFWVLDLMQTPYFVISYEALLNHPQAFGNWLLNQLDLPCITVNAIDANEKYYATVET